jgi:16S rRNA (guanine527-N7)-methyltransferase
MNLQEFSQKYFELIQQDYAGINLTAYKDWESFHRNLVIDSIGPLEQSSFFKGSLEQTEFLVDVGFGGGFPLVPLAFSFPGAQFLGIDSQAKKVKVVQEITEKFAISNVKVAHYRIQEVLFDRPAVITFKAVGKIKAYLQEINFESPVRVFFYKGPNWEEQEGKYLVGLKNRWKLSKIEEINIPGLEKRFLISFENTVKEYIVPHGTNSLARISELS